jgi:hypothetical protein
MAIRPAYPDAGTISSNWQRGVQQNADKWLEGMENPRKDPKAAALAAKDSWKNGVTKAVQEDAYTKGIQASDPNEAIATARLVGTQGYAAGAMARKDKHARVMQRIAPLMATAVSGVRGLPNATDADRENRAVAMIRAARNVGKAAKGR